MKGLKSEFSASLLRAILAKLEQKQQEHEYTEALYVWLQAVFKYKAADLISERGTVGALVPIYKAIEDRTLHFDKLLMLKGKLDLLMQLGEKEKSQDAPRAEPKYEAVKVLDENAEEDIEGVEVIDIKEYKKTAELLAESEMAAVPAETKMKDAEEELPDVVEMEEEEEEIGKTKNGKASDSEDKMDDEEDK